MSKKWIYIPIETKVRELYGKLFLACLAASKNFNVIIGSRKGVYPQLNFSPKGIVFGFSLAETYAKKYANFKKRGFKVAAIDEEGLVTLKDDLYLKHRVSKNTMRVADIFFCWGERQASLIRKKDEESSRKIAIVGNPRFDMLRREYRSIFEKDVEKIKKKYGKIILINTNFGHANHFLGDESAINSLKQKGWMDTEEDSIFFLRLIKFQKDIYKSFLEIIPKISEKFENYTIIIRPHPSENHDSWKKIEKKCPNVFVAHSGNVIPWIIASDILIHNGCTTAIEALLLGKRAVSYRPIIINEVESDLPNKASLQARTSEELLAIMENILSNKLFFSEKDFKKELGLDSYLSGFEGETASEKIVSIFESWANPADKKSEIILMLRKFFLLSKEFIKKLLLAKPSLNVKADSYFSHKMPELTEKEMKEIIEEFSKVRKEFSKLRIKKIDESCFKIYAN